MPLHKQISQPAKALAGIVLTVAVVQGLSFVANIITVRALPVAEYALLTSSLSLLGLLTAIADSGLSQAALTVGGLHHDSEKEKALVFKRCRSLVLRTGLAGSVLVVPIWIWMGQKLEADNRSIVLVGIFLFGGYFIVLGLNIFKSFLLLDGKRPFTQRIDITKTILRVALLAVGIFVFPAAAYVIFCSFVAEVFGWWCFRKELQSLRHYRSSNNNAITKEVDKVFWRLMPSTIYRAISQQVLLLLLIAFGSVSSVAGAGALSRFHQVFIFVPSVAANALQPRLAKTKGEVARNRMMALFIFAGWSFALFIYMGIYTATHLLLSLLGNPYEALHSEFRILMASSCLNVMSGVCYGLLNSRGWVIPPFILISSSVLFILIAILTCDVSTLSGFAVMHCIIAGGSLGTTVAWALACLKRRR